MKHKKICLIKFEVKLKKDIYINKVKNMRQMYLKYMN